LSGRQGSMGYFHMAEQPTVSVGVTRIRRGDLVHLEQAFVQIGDELGYLRANLSGATMQICLP
ncbi:MAG: hypothetical protein ACKPKO_11410, partial [Candidatus Fonsibacter sp.]